MSSVYSSSISFVHRPWFMCRRACGVFLIEKKFKTEESNRSHSSMFYSLLLFCMAMFSLIWLLFSENIFESSPCQSVFSPSPSAGLVIGGWSAVPQGAGALSGLQACLWGTLTRQNHQTASSGYCMTHNTHHGPPRLHHLQEKPSAVAQDCDCVFNVSFSIITQTLSTSNVQKA